MKDGEMMEELVEKACEYSVDFMAIHSGIEVLVRKNSAAWIHIYGSAGSGKTAVALLISKAFPRYVTIVDDADPLQSWPKGITLTVSEKKLELPESSLPCIQFCVENILPHDIIKAIYLTA